MSQTITPTDLNRRGEVLSPVAYTTSTFIEVEKGDVVVVDIHYPGDRSDNLTIAAEFASFPETIRDKDPFVTTVAEDFTVNIGEWVSLIFSHRRSKHLIDNSQDPPVVEMSQGSSTLTVMAYKL